jgi:amino acid permease
VSILLFGCTGIFLLLIFVYVCIYGTSQNFDLTYDDYWGFKVNRKTITAISVYIFAFGVQINVYAMYTSLKDKTTITAMKATMLTMIMALSLYVVLSIVVIYLFGSNIKETFLNNLDDFPNPMSYAIRIIFLIIVVFHVPFIFFACKDFMLTIIDELMRNSVSSLMNKETNSDTKLNNDTN